MVAIRLLISTEEEWDKRLQSLEQLVWKDKTDLALRCITDNVVDTLSQWYQSQHGAKAILGKPLDEVARLALTEMEDPNVISPRFFFWFFVLLFQESLFFRQKQ